jgi:hypothetical protein
MQAWPFLNRFEHSAGVRWLPAKGVRCREQPDADVRVRHKLGDALTAIGFNAKKLVKAVVLIEHLVGGASVRLERTPTLSGGRVRREEVIYRVRVHCHSPHGIRSKRKSIRNVFGKLGA